MKRKKMAMNKTNERIEEDEIAACKTDVKLKVDLKHKQPARAARVRLERGRWSDREALRRGDGRRGARDVADAIAPRMCIALPARSEVYPAVNNLGD